LNSGGKKKQQENKGKKAGAELCQAQAQVDLPADAEFNLTVEFQNCTSLENIICPHVLLFSSI
jgi:hypothetical protein